MKIIVSSFSSTAEVSDSVNQIAVSFDRVLAPLAGMLPDFAGFGRLVLYVTAAHPLTRSRAIKGKARYSAGDIYADAPIDYSVWATADWNDRTDEFARTLDRAIQAISKTRISNEERATLFALVAEVSDRIRQSPPDKMTEIKPVYLVFASGSEQPSISYGTRPEVILPDQRLVVLEPGDAAAYDPDPIRSRSAPPGLFKLYRRMDNGVLRYHEAWTSGNLIIEHWGICGDSGQTKEHPVHSDAEARRVLARLKTSALSNGYHPIPRSRHVTLVVERIIDGFGTSEDLERRYDLEDFLNEKTGWLGLGHCDGGSIGSGSMEAFCEVVDFTIATQSLVRELASSPFSDFTIRRMR